MKKSNIMSLWEGNIFAELNLLRSTYWKPF